MNFGVFLRFFASEYGVHRRRKTEKIHSKFIKPRLTNFGVFLRFLLRNFYAKSP